MKKGFNVLWFLLYGFEMRGGIVNCSVIILSDMIGFFVVFNFDILFVLNKFLFEKFEYVIKKSGFLFVNSFFVDIFVNRNDVNVYYILVIEIVLSVGNV